MKQTLIEYLNFIVIDHVIPLDHVPSALKNAQNIRHVMAYFGVLLPTANLLVLGKPVYTLKLLHVGYS